MPLTACGLATSSFAFALSLGEDKHAELLARKIGTAIHEANSRKGSFHTRASLLQLTDLFSEKRGLKNYNGQDVELRRDCFITVTGNRRSAFISDGRPVLVCNSR